MMNDRPSAGWWLRRFAARRFDQQALDRVVLPAIADLQHECAQSTSRRVQLRAYVGVCKAMASVPMP